MALLIAATHSGAGKSTVTLGILRALRKRGLTVQPFKAGPDFIDPGLHGLAAKRISRNLDLWMCGAEYVRRCFAEHSKGAGAAVIEGVMGYYDGGGRSTAELARTLRSEGVKVALVIDASGMAESAAAMAKGFMDFGGPVDAVILNRVGSEAHAERLRKALEDVIPVLGCLPRDAGFEIPHRHLGLHIAEEAPISEDALVKLAEVIEANMDMDKVVELCRPIAEGAKDSPLAPARTKVRLAIARDRAFSFYYEDNLDMLRAAGAELVHFSPLADKQLPEGIDAVYLGGGYPELYARELSDNVSMRDAIKAWAEAGKPLYAECGGLMYLSRSLRDTDGTTYPMAGVFPVDCTMLGKRAALGYREVVLSEDCILGPRDSVLRGHEYHYSRITSHAQAEGVKYNVLGEGEGREITSMSKLSTLASYVHVHFGSRPEAASPMIDYIKGAICRQ